LTPIVRDAVHSLADSPLHSGNKLYRPTAGVRPCFSVPDLFYETVSRGLYPILRTRAETVVGMDLSLTIARRARSRTGSLETPCANARHLPFAAGVIDVIVSDSTLDHFHWEAELVASLRELLRGLRHGWQLLITLDNRANPLIALLNG
jgi:SAM-dependent methyltransferase